MIIHGIVNKTESGVIINDHETEWKKTSSKCITQLYHIIQINSIVLLFYRKEKLD